MDFKQSIQMQYSMKNDTDKRCSSEFTYKSFILVLQWSKAFVALQGRYKPLYKIQANGVDSKLSSFKLQKSEIYANGKLSLSITQMDSFYL